MNRSPEQVHVHVRRVVLDAAATGNLPRELLLEQLSAAIAQRLGAAASPDRLAPIASRVGDVVAPAITRTLGARHG